jgi:hypothetical protein
MIIECNKSILDLYSRTELDEIHNGLLKAIKSKLNSIKRIANVDDIVLEYFNNSKIIEAIIYGVDDILITRRSFRYWIDRVVKNCNELFIGKFVVNNELFLIDFVDKDYEYSLELKFEFNGAKKNKFRFYVTVKTISNNDTLHNCWYDFELNNKEDCFDLTIK